MADAANPAKRDAEPATENANAAAVAAAFAFQSAKSRLRFWLNVNWSVWMSMASKSFCEYLPL